MLIMHVTDIKYDFFPINYIYDWCKEKIIYVNIHIFILDKKITHL